MAVNASRVLGGRYEVGETIGRGGMAEVHIGHDTRLGRTVAIKILRADLARDPSFLARFRREAQAAAALNHPSIVAVYDTGEDNFPDPTTGVNIHVPFIVMEYVEGHTVREILNHGDAVPIDEAVEITSGVLSALEYSHRAGIVHRDIKPGNIMITPAGAIKVMDFGIARAVADSGATMTQTQAVIGTAQYLSPEQARGETVDARSDLYSTGCVLYELLTGRPPFTGDSPVAVAYQHVGQMPRLPSEVAGDIPPALDSIVMKSLAKERVERYSTAAEFKADLDAFLAGGQIAAKTISQDPGATQVFGASLAATTVMRPTGTDATAVYSSQPANRFAIAGGGVVSATTAGSPHQIAGPNWGQLSQPMDEPTTGTLEPIPAETNRRRLLMWILIPLAIIGIGLTAFFLARGPAEPDVPPIEMGEVPTFSEGISEAQACADIFAASFECMPLIDANSNLPAGTFLRQDPRGGSQLALGETVTVWFSGGPSIIAVPNVTGMNEQQARNVLQEAGLTVGEITAVFSPDQPAGNVVSTQPDRGIAVNPGDVVSLFVSNGLVDLPNLTGRTLSEAQAVLSELWLPPVVLQEVSTTLAPGTIIRHSPVAGQIAQRTSVTLTVAIAPEIVMLTVPNIVGQQWLAVSGQLEGFNVPQPATAPSSTIPPGHVISTNPPAGTQLESGSTVTVVVSSGPEPTVSPSPTPTETPTDPPTEGPGNGNGNNSQNANHNSGNSNNSNNSSNNSSNNGRGNSRRNRALAEAVTNVYHAIAQQTRGLLGWHLQT